MLPCLTVKLNTCCNINFYGSKISENHNHYYINKAILFLFYNTVIIHNSQVDKNPRITTIVNIFLLLCVNLNYNLHFSGNPYIHKSQPCITKKKNSTTLECIIIINIVVTVPCPEYGNTGK